MIWEIRHDSENFRTIFPQDEVDWKPLLELSRGEFSGDWKPIKVEVSTHKIEAEEGPSRDIQVEDARKEGDFYMLPSGLPVVTEKSWSAIEDLIGKQVRLLELNCDRGNLWIVDPLHTVDCLDKEASSFARLPTGEIVLANVLSFRRNCIEDLHIFKISIFQAGAVFVKETFKEIIDNNELSGLRFRDVST